MKLLLFILSFLFYNSAQAADVVMFDIGHTKLRPGATSCYGKKEYFFNKSLTLYIIKYLNKNGIKSELSNEINFEIKLKDRTKNSKGKKLFLSIHHDSAQEKYIKYINGNPCSNNFSGYSIFVSRKNPFFDESVFYAKKLGTYLKSYGLKYTTHHNEKIKGENREFLDRDLGIYFYDDLVVLKNAKCPAILLEAAVIINPHDEILSQNPDFMKIIADSIYKTIFAGGT